jgi:OOP family OmpA-OmpF porin
MKDKTMRYILKTIIGTLLMGATVAAVADEQSDSSGRGGWMNKGPDAGLYAGVDVSHNMNDDFLPANNDGSLSNISLDDSATGADLFVGYQFNDNFSVEAGYSDKGKQSFSADSAGGTSWEAGPVATDFDASGLYLRGLFRYPVSDRVALLARVGMLSWKTTERYTEPSGVSEQKDSGVDAEYGVGAEYDIGEKDKWFLRVMYGSANVDDDSLQNTSVNGGFFRRF